MFIAIIVALLKFTISLLIVDKYIANKLNMLTPNNLNNIKPKLPYCIVHNAIGLSSTPPIFPTDMVLIMSNMLTITYMIIDVIMVQIKPQLSISLASSGGYITLISP